MPDRYLFRGKEFVAPARSRSTALVLGAAVAVLSVGGTVMLQWVDGTPTTTASTAGEFIASSRPEPAVAQPKAEPVRLTMAPALPASESERRQVEARVAEPAAPVAAAKLPEAPKAAPEPAVASVDDSPIPPILVDAEPQQTKSAPDPTIPLPRPAPRPKIIAAAADAQSAPVESQRAVAVISPNVGPAGAKDWADTQREASAGDDSESRNERAVDGKSGRKRNNHARHDHGPPREHARDAHRRIRPMKLIGMLFGGWRN